MKPDLAKAAALAVALAATALVGPRVAAAQELDPFAALPPASTASDRVIVMLRDAGPAATGQAKPTDAQSALRIGEIGRRAGLRARSLKRLGSDLHVVEVERAGPGESLQETLSRLRADPSVEFAEPDARMRPHRIPNDPGFAEQWFLQATVPGPDGPTDSAADAVAAWEVTTGSPAVVVAVLDTGVRFDHPDLLRVADGGKLLPGYDFVSAESGGTARAANDGNGWDADASDPGDWISPHDRTISQFADCTVSSSSWHGTRVSGLLAGLTDNAAGIAAIGWDNRILPVRVLGKCGGLTSDIIAGMRWAAGLSQSGAPANPTPARVLNLSLGGQGACSMAYQSAIDEITARGVTVIVSAGNDGSTVDQPANCRGVVSVTGVRHVGTKVGFANLGPGVTIAAPGGNCVNVTAGAPCLYSIDTTTNSGATTPAENGYTDRFGDFNVGTSFAAPIVSGIAALMYSVNGRLPPAELTERLRATARAFPAASDPNVPTCRIPESSSDLQLSECNCTSQTCGAGLAHAPGAVDAALRPVAVVSAPSTASAGASVVLTGAASVGADGRTITAYTWTLVSGATALSALAGSETAFVAPDTDVVVRLTVTDDQGRNDSTDATVRVASATPPPTPPSSLPVPTPRPIGSSGGGGGGLFDPLALTLAAALAWRARRRRPVETPHAANVKPRA
jgi:serine protease